MFTYIMALVRRDDTGWGLHWQAVAAAAARHSTSSGLAIANVLGSQWGLLFS
jgi:hypothetical protein